MNNLEYAKQQLGRFYFDITESQRQNPSYPFIEKWLTQKRKTDNVTSKLYDHLSKLSDLT